MDEMFQGVKAIEDAGGVQPLLRQVWNDAGKRHAERIRLHGDPARTMFTVDMCIQEAIEKVLLPDVSRELKEVEKRVQSEFSNLESRQAKRALEQAENPIRDKYDRIAGWMKSRLMTEGPNC